MARFHVGAVLDRIPSPRYFEGGVSHLELALHGTPRVATARKMRASVPTAASLALQLPRELCTGAKGALRHEDPRTELELLAMIEALAPQLIVLVSGVALTPSTRDREALAGFAERMQAAKAPPLVWQAGGPWEIEDATRFAARIGVVPAFDPLEPVMTVGPVAYARVRAIGVHARLGDGTLARIAEALLTRGADDTYVAIEAAEGPRRARRLAQILAGETGRDDEDDDEPHDDDE